jgi:hypothetical protein
MIGNALFKWDFVKLLIIGVLLVITGLGFDAQAGANLKLAIVVGAIFIVAGVAGLIWSPPDEE